MNAVKNYILYVTATILIATGFYLTGFLYGTVRDEQARHHRYVRETEIKLHDLRSRLGVLEEMRIELHVIDHTGLWMVESAKVD